MTFIGNDAGFRTASQVAGSDLDSHTSGSFIAARQVVGQPSDIPRECGIDPQNCDEDAGIYNSWNASSRCRNAHDETNGGDAHAGEYERRTLASAVGQPCYHNCKSRGGDVDGSVHDKIGQAVSNLLQNKGYIHCKKLSGRGGIAELIDDCWEEEADPVERTHNTPVH